MHTHHAYLVRGASEEAVTAAITTLKTTYAVVVYTPVSWGIDESRALLEEASRTDGAGRPRAFVVVTNSITLEAQNALLKLLEEPPQGSIFFFYVPRDAVLLPTLCSRFMIEDVVTAESPESTFATEWRTLGIAEQLKEIEGRTKKKDLVWIEWFKREALLALQTAGTTLEPTVAARLQYAVLSLGTRGASNKMLLEEVALLFTAHLFTPVSSGVKTR